MTGARGRGGDGRAPVAHAATGISSVLILVPWLRELRARGLDVQVLCNDDDWGRKVAAEGFRVHDVAFPRGVRPLALARALAQLARNLRRERYALLHTHNAASGIFGRPLARLAGVPAVVHTCHGWPFYEGQSAPVYHAFVWLERIAGWFTDVVLFQNRDDAEAARRLRVLPERKIRHLGNGIDVAGFAARVAAADPEAIRAEFPALRGRKVVTKIARLEAVKGHDFFFAGLRRLRERVDAVGLLVGYGLDHAEVERWAAREGVRDHVVFTGFREDIPALLRASDVVALTSRKEGVPRSLLEAMVAGVPILTTDVPGNRDAVAHEVNGLLVGYGDVAALAEGLARLLTDDDLRARLAAAARARVEREFDAQAVVQRMLDVYAALGVPGEAR